MNDEEANVPNAAALRDAHPNHRPQWVSRRSARGSGADLGAFDVDLRFFPSSREPEGCQKSSTNGDTDDAPSTQRRSAPRLATTPTLPAPSARHRRGGQRELPARTSAQLTSVLHFFGLWEGSENVEKSDKKTDLNGRRRQRRRRRRRERDARAGPVDGCARGEHVEDDLRRDGQPSRGRARLEELTRPRMSSAGRRRKQVEVVEERWG